MPKRERFSGILVRIEVLLAVVLFFVMLICCGMYIDIKMNGKSASLPPIPEKERAMLIKSDIQSDIVYDDDLIEPTFIGIKNEDAMYACLADDYARKSTEGVIYDDVLTLLSANAKKVEFSSDREYTKYIEALKNSSRYILVSFMSDIPSNAFFSCLSDNYAVNTGGRVFNIKHLFILGYDNDKISGVAISQSNEVTQLEVVKSASFNKLVSRAYDNIDGFSKFEFAKSDDIRPVISTSFSAHKYCITNMAVQHGKERDSKWVDDILEFFCVNKSLVKSFNSGDKSEINYVDELCEVLFGDDGTVKFTATTSDGINLYEYLGYYPDNNDAYSFNDKIFAVKNMVNGLNSRSSLISYAISGMNYSEQNDSFKIYLKAMCDGVFVTEEMYDAYFEIQGNRLMQAKILAAACIRANEMTAVVPQKYASFMFDNAHNADCYMVMKPDEANSELVAVGWAALLNKDSAEVK